MNAVNPKDEMTAMMYVCKHPAGKAVVVKALLEAGAKPGLKSKEGKTAAMLAHEAGKSEIAEMLAKVTGGPADASSLRKPKKAGAATTSSTPQAAAKSKTAAASGSAVKRAGGGKARGGAVKV